MPATFYLHGNHDRCEACELRREAAARHLAEGGWPALHPLIPCNLCGGTGLVGLTDKEIVRRTVAEARRTYWPRKEAPHA